MTMLGGHGAQPSVDGMPSEVAEADHDSEVSEAELAARRARARRRFAALAVAAAMVAAVMTFGTSLLGGDPGDTVAQQPVAAAPAASSVPQRPGPPNRSARTRTPVLAPGGRSTPQARRPATVAAGRAESRWTQAPKLMSAVRRAHARRHRAAAARAAAVRARHRRSLARRRAQRTRTQHHRVRTPRRTS